MAFEAVPRFMVRLRECDERARFMGHWTEIDFEKKVWTVPATRMKAARQHRIPLSDQARGIAFEKG
jgi:hypothetical protein